MEDIRRRVEEAEEQENAVVRRALASAWNAYGDEIAREGLEGFASTVASWDTDGVFRRRLQVVGNDHDDDARFREFKAIAYAVRRVVEQALADGTMIKDDDQRWRALSLGVTFRNTCPASWDE